MQAKKKINLTVDHKTYSALETLSGQRREKISAVSLYLIQQALELQEDLYFSKEADSRLSQNSRRVSQFHKLQTARRFSPKFFSVKKRALFFFTPLIFSFV